MPERDRSLPRATGQPVRCTDGGSALEHACLACGYAARRGRGSVFPALLSSGNRGYQGSPRTAGRPHVNLSAPDLVEDQRCPRTAPAAAPAKGTAGDGDTAAHAGLGADRLAARQALGAEALARGRMRAVRLLSRPLVRGAGHRRHGEGPARSDQPPSSLARLPGRGRRPVRTPPLSPLLLPAGPCDLEEAHG